jgi:hypothetical protein
VRNTLPYTGPEKEKICELYSSGQSINKIHNWCKNNGLLIGKAKIVQTIKSSGTGMKTLTEAATEYAVNETVFDVINTAEKAYWLGFLYADGYLTKDKVVGCKLSIKDEDHLLKFKQFICPTKPIYYDTTSQGFGNNTSSCALILTNKHLFNSLQDKGCTKKKSLTLKFPSEQQLPREFVYDFIRGYFDGDGSVYCSTNPKRVGMGIVGTYDFLLKVREYLFEVNLNKYIYKYKNKNVYELKFGGTEVVKTIYEKLYYTNCICLTRKYQKFKEYYNAN